MALNIGQKVWAKHSGCHGYHRVTIVMEIYNGESFLLRWRKDVSVICARNMMPFIASHGLTVTMRGVRYHSADMAGSAPH
eukprot:7440170-Ditylum_brightwellii.AAC.1